MTGTGPLVSVILPTYNRAALLPGAINSVLSQTYPNWELVIWDDGSTDNTEEVVRSHSDRRINYHRDENHGVSYARNRAIELSRGEYVAFLDSDDEWMAGKLSAQVEVMNSHPQIDLLFTDFLSVSQTRSKALRAFEHYSRAMRLLRVEHAGENLFIIDGGFLEGLAVVDFIATDTAILRQGVLKRVGCFNEELRSSEDFELWWRMGLAGFSFAYLDRPYLTRYKYTCGLSSPSVAGCLSRMAALDICLQGSRARGRTDLINHLRPCYRNAWMNMISACSAVGDYRGVLKAFRESTRYGLRPGALRLLARAIWELTKQPGPHQRSSPLGENRAR